MVCVDGLCFLVSLIEGVYIIDLHFFLSLAMSLVSSFHKPKYRQWFEGIPAHHGPTTSKAVSIDDVVLGSRYHLLTAKAGYKRRKTIYYEVTLESLSSCDTGLVLSKIRQIFTIGIPSCRRTLINHGILRQFRTAENSN